MQNQNAQIERIRSYYSPSTPTKLDELIALDKKAKRPATVFSYVFGSAGSLILGCGMSLAMKVIGASLPFAMPLGIAVGVVGIALVSATYPIYKGMLNKSKKKYADRILTLSDEALNN